MQTAQAIAVVATPPKPAKPAAADNVASGQAVSETLPVQAAALSTPSAPVAEEPAVDAVKEDDTANPAQTALVSPAPLPEPKAEAPAAPPEAVPDRAASVLQRGHGLMAKGDVAAARVLFVQGMEFGSPEAALALGRSFDPEFLGRVPNANAEPDAGRAEAMYREWHRRSLAEGSVAPGVKLSKLIQAMRRQ